MICEESHKKRACTGFKTLTDPIPNASQTEDKFARPSIIVAIRFTWSLLLTLEPTGGAVVARLPPPPPPWGFSESFT